ncbi:ABC transporter ATP-binding protein [Deferribacter autotrophicus]|uniref:ABC transporter ATP-binding protein n=1 Tax=Deferribacter autotrophicus TaxID=500465 RepID=A0A5A8F0V7_9BACT|nr:ABC transporter ATP-binding protein [Deferribacter autotrophicus]KAA0256890.1 ABC transporter ATP-binding protein [Deferribacter autotrophicus]
MLVAKNIYKSYSSNGIKNLVLKNISIEINSSDFVCIVGRSGSGKSTLINVLSTLLKPDEGTILYNNIDITSLSEKELNNLRLKDFSIVFQFHHLMPYLTAIENVLLPFMSNFKPVTKKQYEKAKEALAKVGLAGKENRLPGQLSGGEQQRVAIARAIVKSPKVLFADEPTGSLDKANGDEVIKILHNLNDEGIAVVMVTHEINYAKNCSKVIEMEDGIIKSIN